MTLTLRHTGGDDVQEWAIALGGLVGGGGLVELLRALLGRKAARVDAVAKLEQIAMSIAEKATMAADARGAAADARVEHVERKLSELESQAARRRVAMVAHGLWDEQLVASLRELGVSVPPPPPLEVV